MGRSQAPPDGRGGIGSVGATAHGRSHQRSSPPRSWRAGQRTGNFENVFWVSKCFFKITNNCWLLSAVCVLLCYIRVEKPPLRHRQGHSHNRWVRRLLTVIVSTRGLDFGLGGDGL